MSESPRGAFLQVWLYCVLADGIDMSSSLRGKLMNGEDRFLVGLAELSEEERRELKSATIQYAARVTLPATVSISALWELIDFP